MWRPKTQKGHAKFLLERAEPEAAVTPNAERVLALIFLTPREPMILSNRNGVSAFDILTPTGGIE